MSAAAEICRVDAIDAGFEPRRWPWAEANRSAIAAHWARRQAVQPRLFNGRVLLVSEQAIAAHRLAVSFFEVDYAALIAWIDLGFPDPSVANGFAMGALQGSDGAFVLGIMAPHTANAGQIYFAAGTPDRSDVTQEGRVDLARSLTRELAEETGLRPCDYDAVPGWIVVRQGALTAFMRVLRCHDEGEAVRRRILAHLGAEDEPELAGIHLARGEADIDPQAMPDYLQSFLRWSFAQAAD